MRADLSPVSAQRSYFSCRNLSAKYGEDIVVRDVSLDIGEGEILILKGPRGAGKSALLRTVARKDEPELIKGEIWLRTHSLHDKRSYEAATAGVQLVPEGRRIIPGLTVSENLDLARIPVQSGWSDEKIFEMFPRLGELRDQDGIKLSGAEQQMLAMARVLSRHLKLLLLDDPCAGLPNRDCEKIEAVLQSIKSTGVTTIVVEQDTSAAIELADSVALIEQGEIVLCGTPEVLLRN